MMKTTTPNPMIPKPNFQDRRKRVVRIIVILAAFSAVILTGLLILAAVFLNSATPVQATIVLRPVGHQTILFKSNNGETKNKIPAEEKHIPHLVLYRNGQVTDPGQRTVAIDVNWQLAPRSTAGLELILETQNGNPDAGGGAVNRITVWQQKISLPAAPILSGEAGTLRLIYTFPGELPAGEGRYDPTPTGYYRLKILAKTPGKKSKIKVYEQDYALLLENQMRVPLPSAGQPPAGPQELVIYYTDMTPIQVNTYGVNNRVPRTAVSNYVQYALIPGMQEILQLLIRDWGFTWSPAWKSFREDEDKYALTVALTDDAIWYHGPAPEGGFGLISINIHQLKLNTYSNSTEWILSIFSHELFHNLQRSINLAYGNLGDNEGSHQAWEIITEGTAMLVESLVREEFEYSPGPTDDPYTYHLRSFVDSLAANNITSKSSYRNISPYDLVVYWRFLYDNCNRDLGPGSTVRDRIDIVKDTLEVLYSQPVLLESSREDLPQNFEKLMDQVIPRHPHCPYHNYQESLAAFARSLYALRLEPPGTDANSATISYSVPEPERPAPTPIPAAASLTFSDSPLNYEDQIAASYGIDFIELRLVEPVTSGALQIDFRSLSTMASYQLQIIQYRTTAAADGNPQIDGTHTVLYTGETEAGGSLHFRLAGLDQPLSEHLAIIITRIDDQEAADSTGRYQLEIQPASSPSHR